MERSLRKIYKHIQRLSGSAPETIAWDPDTGHIFRADNHALNHKFESPGECAAALELLQQRGYIEYIGNNYFFCLTFKGLHPYEVRWEGIKAFLLKSILVPIFVSIVAATVTAWLYIQLNLAPATLPPS